MLLGLAGLERMSAAGCVSLHSSPPPLIRITTMPAVPVTTYVPKPKKGKKK